MSHTLKSPFSADKINESHQGLSLYVYLLNKSDGGDH